MIDELLGRARLKNRISDLEAQCDRLEQRLEAEGDRRAKAVRDRQESNELANTLRDRIADLEGQIERISNNDRDFEFQRVEIITGHRLDEILNRLLSVTTRTEGAMSAMINGSVPDELHDLLGERWPLVDRASPCLVFADDARLVDVALAPPILPDPFLTWADTFLIDREWFLPTGRFTFALVRSDLFAMGEFHGTDRQSIVGFKSDVMENHSKGGFSQGRFERRRDNQIDRHLDRCKEVISDREHERVYVVGQRTLLSQFRSDADQTAPVDATGNPEDALEDAFRQFWRTTLYLI